MIGSCDSWCATEKEKRNKQISFFPSLLDQIQLVGSLSAYFKDLDEADKPAYVKKTHAE